MSNLAFRYLYPDTHSDICNCASCHQSHNAWENFENPDYQCCRDEIKTQVEWGHCCGKKPLDHSTWFMKDKKCLFCEHEKECNYRNHTDCGFGGRAYP